MQGGTTYEVAGVFDSRDDLERAMEALEGKGFDRSQLSLLGTNEAVEAKLGLNVREDPSKTNAEGAVEDSDVAKQPRQEPLKRDETGNLTGLMTGIPTYLAAVLAAGVTAASGGTLAGVAVAALAGGAGGGLVGGSAAKLFNDQIDAGYEEQLQQGGILLFVSLNDPGESDNAKAVLSEHAARNVQLHVHTNS